MMANHKLRLKTLGGLAIKRNGQVIAGLPLRKAEALLVYLACNPRVHPREALAELL
ncbi:MAG TPA: hypothetical protein VK879_16020 [Candidatus Sulfomarinibacteraceae bacterium]|nr:hypothetical protein [Candidatus Sulfomarinibacteraceae bacterium]